MVKNLFKKKNATYGFVYHSEIRRLKSMKKELLSDSVNREGMKFLID